jgi:hypothetical protein
LFKEVDLHGIGDIEEWFLEKISILDDADPSNSLENEEASCSIVGTCHVDRIDQAIGNLDKLERGIAGQIAARLRNLRVGRANHAE